MGSWLVVTVSRWEKYLGGTFMFTLLYPKTVVFSFSIEVDEQMWGSFDCTTIPQEVYICKFWLKKYGMEVKDTLTTT